jgi:hypothetical protein
LQLQLRNMQLQLERQRGPGSYRNKHRQRSSLDVPAAANGGAARQSPSYSTISSQAGSDTLGPRTTSSVSQRGVYNKRGTSLHSTSSNMLVSALYDSVLMRQAEGEERESRMVASRPRATGADDSAAAAEAGPPVRDQREAPALVGTLGAGRGGRTAGVGARRGSSSRGQGGRRGRGASRGRRGRAATHLGDEDSSASGTPARRLLRAEKSSVPRGGYAGRGYCTCNAVWGHRSFLLFPPLPGPNHLFFFACAPLAVNRRRPGMDRTPEPLPEGHAG